jgi:glycosyltransferase involved in cell wall biosynthesis
MPIDTLDVVTVTKNDLKNLETTRQSIEILSSKYQDTITWILVDSGDKSKTQEFLQRNQERSSTKTKYFHQSDFSIYQAMNFGLKNVTSDYFMFINSGDVVLNQAIELLKSLDADKVACFQSEWHNSNNEKINFREKSQFSLILGKMPNHQAMVFPNKFSRFKYNEEYAISADQDLKIKLAKQSMLVVREEIVVSSLFGGLTTRTMAPVEVFRRATETAKIIKSNYRFPWSAILTLIYFLNFLRKIRLEGNNR